MKNLINHAKIHFGYSKLLLLFIDIIVYFISYHLTYWFRFRSLPEQSNAIGLLGIIILLPIWIFILYYHDLYKHKIYILKLEQFVRLIKSQFIMFFIVIILEFMLRISFFQTSRLAMCSFILCLLIFSMVMRGYFYSTFFRIHSKSSIHIRKAIIVGTGKDAKMAASQIILNDMIPIEILGFVNAIGERRNKNIFSKPILGNFNSLSKIVNEFKPDKLILSPSLEKWNDFFKVFDKCKTMDLPLIILTKQYHNVISKIQNSEYSLLMGMKIDRHYYRMLDQILKRIFDIIFSTLSLLILSPLFLMLSVLIKIDSKGPVLFIQERLGKDAKPFLLYKFRSMKINNDNTIHKNYLNNLIRKGKHYKDDKNKLIYKISNDPRVTKFGLFLRKTSLDELPQLINVIKNDMSLVGPRPCLDYEYKIYDEWHKRRLNVLPGLTGIWQVKGRSAVNFDDMVAMDLYYVENWSFWMDLKIIFQTIPKVLFARGAH